ncbi:hypothetical protein ACFU96_45730 [Streptomyces sp. NPDC057620]|uniref:hypothetical protein n=1 Tax=Streptomyces sp. NPDC057620 TaxID=3346185 RepID=UPI003674A634
MARGLRATGSSGDGAVRVWDRVTGSCTATLGHIGSVSSVAIAPDSTWLAPTSLDQTVRIRDVSKQRTVAVARSEGALTSCSWGPAGELVVGGPQGSVPLRLPPPTCPAFATSPSTSCATPTPSRPASPCPGTPASRKAHLKRIKMVQRQMSGRAGFELLRTPAGYGDAFRDHRSASNQPQSVKIAASEDGLKAVLLGPPSRSRVGPMQVASERAPHFGAQHPSPQHSAVTRAFAASHGSDGPVGRLLIVPAAAAVELNEAAAVNQRRSTPPPCPYSGVRGGRSMWGKRPAHSATEPGYGARRTGPTPTMAVA